MRPYSALLLWLLVTAQVIQGQHAHFTVSGTIAYNRSMNMYALLKKRVTKDNEAFMQPIIESYMKSNPQTKVLKSTLSFRDNQTLFTPEEAESDRNGFFSDDPVSNQYNTIYTDLRANRQVAQRTVFEQTFLVTDTPRRFKWKITGETREIAGYTCRRANGLMLDSIYVVAFYAPEIPVSGGPESFSGLPGMILGVALPHENLSWFATRVTDTSLPPEAVLPPKKGKPVNNATFWDTIHKATKDWGQWGQVFLKGFSF